jgi:hypothetical protein
MKSLFFLFLLLPILSFGQLFKEEQVLTYRAQTTTKRNTLIIDNEILNLELGKVGVYVKNNNNWELTYFLKSPVSLGIGYFDGFQAEDSTLVMPAPNSCQMIVYKKRQGKWVLNQSIHFGDSINCNYGSYDLKDSCLVVLENVYEDGFYQNSIIKTYVQNKNGKFEIKNTWYTKDRAEKVRICNGKLIVLTYVRSAFIQRFINAYKWTNQGWELTDKLDDNENIRYFGGEMNAIDSQLIVGSKTNDFIPNVKVFNVSSKGKFEFTQKFINPIDTIGHYGTDIDSDGKTLVIGCPLSTVDSGFAIVYARNTENKWTLIDIIKTKVPRGGAGVAVEDDLIWANSNVKGTTGKVYRKCGSVRFSKMHLCNEYNSIDDLKSIPGFEFSSMSFMDTLISQNGCANIQIVGVDTIKPKLNIRLSKSTFFADTGFTNYKWINCTTSDTFTTPISNQFEANANITVKSIANYKNCIVESDCETILFTGLPSANTQVELFPNPALNFICIKGPIKIEFASVFNLNGAKIIEKTVISKDQTLDISTLDRGYYMVVLIGENGNRYYGKFIVSEQK